MLANGLLAISIKGGRVPDGSAIRRRERAKAGVQMIKACVHEFDGNHQAFQEIAEPLMRLYIGTKTIAAEKHIPGKERITLAFEDECFWQAHHFKIMFAK